MHYKIKTILKTIYISSIISTLLLCIGCKKDQPLEPTPTTPSEEIVGVWKWVISCGGFAGTCYTPETAGYTRTVRVTQDSLWIEYHNDTVFAQVKFHIHNQSDSSKVISFDAYFYDEKRIAFRGPDTLRLIGFCCDNFDDTFSRIKN